MKIITLGLWLTFFVLGFMILGGALNFFNSAKSTVTTSSGVDCIGISYSVDYILYKDGVLSFSIKHQNELSTAPVSGVNLRASDNASVIPLAFEKPLSKGMSKRLSLNITLNEEYFFISPIGCSSEYEKRCYVAKETCD